MGDVTNGSEYIGKKGNPIYSNIKKSTDFIKTQNNFLTLKLSTVLFEAAFLVSDVYIKLKAVVGSKLRAFNSLIVE